MREPCIWVWRKVHLAIGEVTSRPGQRTRLTSKSASLISPTEAPVDDTLGNQAMLQHLQHFAKNAQIAETL